MRDRRLPLFVIALALAHGACSNDDASTPTLTAEQVLSAQVKLASCSRPGDAGWLIHFAMIPKLTACVARYEGCEWASKCFGMPISVPAEEACSQGPSSYFKQCLDDKTLLFCPDNGTSTRIDCTFIGGRCEEKDGVAACISSQVTCDPEGRRYHCVDNRVVDCREGLAELSSFSGDCTALGLVCQEFPPTPPDSDDAKCVGTGSACYEHRCEGDVLMNCFDGGEVPFDCKLLGADATCGTPYPDSPDPYYRCLRGEECDSTEEPTCEGNELLLCVAGKITRADCTRYGFSSCQYGRCIE